MWKKEERRKCAQVEYEIAIKDSLDVTPLVGRPVSRDGRSSGPVSHDVIYSLHCVKKKEKKARAKKETTNWCTSSQHSRAESANCKQIY